MRASDVEHGRKVYNSVMKEAAPRARPLPADIIHTLGLDPVVHGSAVAVILHIYS